ncbi:hypothetical protein J2T02_004302 [Chitinophaga terrae (ex Kim and Jung 2007)]|nr:hypothetical protein [Chitinophaga terrae (ex Kim and Jung 2007)]
MFLDYLYIIKLYHQSHPVIQYFCIINQNNEE